MPNAMCKIKCTTHTGSCLHEGTSNHMNGGAMRDTAVEGSRLLFIIILYYITFYYKLLFLTIWDSLTCTRSTMHEHSCILPPSKCSCRGQESNPRHCGQPQSTIPAEPPWRVNHIHDALLLQENKVKR